MARRSRKGTCKKWSKGRTKCLRRSKARRSRRRSHRLGAMPTLVGLGRARRSRRRSRRRSHRR